MANKEDFEPVIPEEESVKATAEDEIKAEAPEADEAAEPAADVAADDAAETDDTAEDKNSEAVAEVSEGDEDDAQEAEADSQTTEADDTSVGGTAEGPAPEKAKKKKPFILQTPVIISLGIVLLALIGYLVYSLFFLHIPQGVIWTADYENDDGTTVTYYFEFDEDGTFKTTVGSIELLGCYKEYSNEDGKSMAFYYNICDFIAGYEAKYTITGSRVLHNQEITFTYGDDVFSFTLHEATDKSSPLELPTEFTPDEDLLGEWYFSYYGVDNYLTFNDDGTMQMKFISGTGENMYTEIDNGTYTIDGSSINFTCYVAQPSVRLYDYEVNGDKLTYAGMTFDRVTEATPDEG